MKIKVLEVVGLLIMTAAVAVFVVSEVTSYWYLIKLVILKYIVKFSYKLT